MTEQSLFEPRLLPICVDRTPSPDDPGDADNYYRALGVLMVAWGRLEGHFTVCLYELLNFPSGDILGVNVKRMFKFKLGRWRMAFEKFEELQSLKVDGLSLANDIQTAANERNDIVHCLWQKFTHTSPLAVEVVTIKNMEEPKNGIWITRKPISIDELKGLCDRINILNTRLLSYSQYITRLRASQQPPPQGIRTI
jgi:hypothetical protein